jgi:hypothetical protein
MECNARGKIGGGNIVIHSPREGRYQCQGCGKTFSGTTGTALYGLKKAADLFFIVVTLLAYGCPVQAIVAASGLDERTVRDWFIRSGQHCQQVHQQFIEKTMLDLGQVQADEIKVKKQRGSVWMALAIMVKTRLWLGAWWG